jgi:hypothetical protein
MLQPGSVRAHIKKGVSQSHPGVSPLNPLTHRNTGFQTLPPPLGLPPYRTIDKNHIKGESTEIDKNGTVKTKVDTFSYPTDAVVLKNPKSVPTL